MSPATTSSRSTARSSGWSIARATSSRISARACATLVGGEVGVEPQLFSESRLRAVDRLRKAALEKGANAVIAMPCDCSEIANIMSEIAAYGTAVKIQKAREGTACVERTAWNNLSPNDVESVI